MITTTGARKKAEPMISGKGKSFGFFFSTTSGGWQLEAEPYTVSAEGSQFQWFRSREFSAGAQIHYVGMSFRFAEYDFKPYDKDGLGFNWPITYQDLALYYYKAEAFICVCGTQENVASCPDGKFHTAPPPKVHETLVKKACDKLGIICIANRRAVITKALNGRAPSNYCGQNWTAAVERHRRIAHRRYKFFPAMKTGRLKVFDLAMPREAIMDGNGKAKGVLYIDKRTRTEKTIYAKAVVLAASACESTRILLNTKTKEFPNGLGNGSGLLGRYLMDTGPGFGLSGYVPALEGMPDYDTGGWMVARTCSFPGGFGTSTTNSISLAAITSKSVGGTG